MKMRRRRRGMGPIWSSGSCRMRRWRGLGCAGTAGRSIRDNPREGDLERLSEHGGGRRARKCSPGEGGGMEGRTGMREGSEPRSCSRTGSRCSRQPGDIPQEGWPFPARTRSITAPIINNRAPQNSPSSGVPPRVPPGSFLPHPGPSSLVTVSPKPLKADTGPEPQLCPLRASEIWDFCQSWSHPCPALTLLQLL